MPDPSPASRRLDAFAPFELELVKAGLLSYATEILEDAQNEEIAESDLDQAAQSYYHAMKLVVEYAEALGEEHPFDDNGLRIVATCIAEGEAPLAAKMAAEVSS